MKFLMSLMAVLCSVQAWAQAATVAPPSPPSAPTTAAPIVPPAAPTTLPPTITARAWILLDVTSAQVLASAQADEPMDPGAFTKLMTAYVTFAALKEKRLGLMQSAPVSSAAWHTSGSRMFLDPERPVAVDSLLHGMIVSQGNDAAVQLAEMVAGSEPNFVTLMNREAARLGLSRTRFVNATGISKTGQAGQTSTARDLATLAAALINDFPEFYPIFGRKEYTYNKVSQTNRNRLLWLDPSVDGLSAVQHEEGGLSLLASSKRGPRRVVTVLLGSESEATRADDSLRLLNWGYHFYESVRLYNAGQTVTRMRIWRGAANTVRAGFKDEFVLSLPKGSSGKLKISLVSRQPLMAPVRRGEVVGSMNVLLGDKPLGDFPLVALDEVPLAGPVGRAWDELRLWLR